MPFPVSGVEYSVRRLPVVALLATPAAAQCIVDNPGGSKANINRPTDDHVPAATFSPLSHLNQEMPSWRCFTLGYRTRLESYSAGNFEPGNSDTYLLTRFRLGMLLKPVSWFKVYTELQDADAFWKNPPLAPPYQATWDLRRAYVDLGDIEQSHIAFRVGRQDLAFGHLRLLGTAYWRNAYSGYDAAMAVVNYSWLRMNVFAASRVVADASGLRHRRKTRVFVKYDSASGDRNPKDGAHGTVDQLYPNIHDHHGLADQIAWQNLKSVRSGEFLIRTNHAPSYTYPYVMINYNFFYIGAHK